jgi:membrane fusion protein (multidrug efflux system)
MSKNSIAQQNTASDKFNVKKWLLGLLLLGAAIAGLTYYWYQSSLHPSTEDAYIHAEILSVSPQITGPVLEVHVDDFVHVNKGDLLLSIDPQSYLLALKQAQASYQLAIQKHNAEDSQVAKAVAGVESARMQLKEAQIEYKRQIILVNKKLAAAQTGDTYKNNLAQAQATLEQSRASLQEATQSRGEVGLETALVQQAAAQLGQAELNLSYTEISAPFDGILGAIEIQKNSSVKAGQLLFPLVKDGSYWLQANYKETALARLKEGQPATISIDMHPDYQWVGQVEKISPASGNAFSLLPSENATGNWVKIKQRFPVKIRIISTADSPALRVGASAVVSIDTTQ